jgi:hypothetical protein
MDLFSFCQSSSFFVSDIEAMAAVGIQAIYKAVAESLKVRVAIGDLQDLLDQGVSSFHGAVRHSSAVDFTEGVEDLLYPVLQGAGEGDEFFDSGKRAVPDIREKIIPRQIDILIIRVIEAQISLIELIGIG